MDAEVLKCAGCGGMLREGAGACPFCHATVAARHCFACFHANLASAVHCAACGRELGLEPVADAAPLSCPGCGPEVGLLALPVGEQGSVYECPRCTGQFVEHGTLRALFEERLALGVGRHRAPPSGELGPVRYVPCPSCHARMNRKNFGECSGVIVDVCRAHGIWFDRGELPRVLAFVEAGGLGEAQRREEARRRQEAKEAAAVSTALAPPTSGRGRDELDFLGDLLRVLRA